jgi:hypothetical protein
MLLNLRCWSLSAKCVKTGKNIEKLFGYSFFFVESLLPLQSLLKQVKNVLKSGTAIFELLIVDNLEGDSSLNPGGF